MTKKNKWLTGIITAMLLIFYNQRKSIMDYSNQKLWDYASELKILNLHPKVRDKAREFINKAEKQGFKLRITSGYRTFDEQNNLYAQGRTKPGSIVTNAKAGQSSHNFGTAIDIVNIVNGNPDWNSDWSKIGAIGKSVGFSWGGDWKTFKDKPHFEMNFGNTLAQLLTKYNNAHLVNGYVLLA